MRQAYVATTRRQRLTARSARMAAMAKQVAAGPKRGAVMGGTCTGVPVPKEQVLNSPTYMARVRTLACRRCGYLPPVGNNQFCHRDQGKGQGIKTDVREGWAGCGPHDGLPGCHWLVGTSGQLPKAERRRAEDEYGASTRAEMRGKGLWPRKLPFWPENQEKRHLGHVSAGLLAINSGANL